MYTAGWQELSPADTFYVKKIISQKLIILKFSANTKYAKVFQQAVPSCFEPHHESKAKCKACVMKISLYVQTKPIFT